jgi:thioredoxin reductase (NADPH)
VLRALRRDLRTHYGDRYRVLAAGSGAEALELLERMADRADPVALLLSDQRMPELDGVQYLLRAAVLFPTAKRVLLTAYADTDAAITAINEVRLDHYLTKPWDPPEQRLFPVLDDLLDDWRAAHQQDTDRILLVGHPIAAATHRVRDFLTRNERPFRFLDVDRDPQGRQLAGRFAGAALPLVVLPGGQVLTGPDNQDLAGATGLAVTASRPHYDVIVVGGGPAGLGAAVYAGSEGLSALLLDADTPGGQAGTSSRIENYLGFPSGVSGADLARRAVTQARRFGVEILNPVRAVALRRADPARIVTLADGTELSAEVVLLTTGVQYNRLDVPGAERFEGVGVYYGAATTESVACQGESVFVVGGANSAGQAAVHFSRYAAQVTMLIRSDDIAKGMSQYLVDEIASRPNIVIRTSSRLVALGGEGELDCVTIQDAAGEETVPARFVFTFIGARPRTEWLAGVVDRDPNGFVLTGPDLPARADDPAAGWDLPRDPLLLETSIPGVFAAGDVRARSVKRVASGVGEGALAVALVHRYRDGA